MSFTLPYPDSRGMIDMCSRIQNGITVIGKSPYFFSATSFTESIKNGGLSHLRHGRGTLRTPAFVYGMPLKNYTSEEAIENAQYAKWHEYAGTWENDKLHGYGVHIQKSGNGGEIVIFEGTWVHGKPLRTSSNDSDDE